MKAAENLKKNAEKSRKIGGGNYTMATNSIASVGDLGTTDRHKLKIKPPKHSFNNVIA